ncbi:MAG: GAF and ANTAR domain-containing protein [Allobranchiibius sp.]
MPDQDEHQLSDLARATRELHAAPGEQERLQLAVRFAAELVPGCGHAGLVRRRQRKIVTVATSDGIAQQAGCHPGGPEAEAFVSDRPVSCADLSTESRWQPWTEHALDTLGIAAVLCLPLRATTRSLGVLTFYFDAPISDMPAALDGAEAFATFVALALDSANTIEHQSMALDTRTEIGQAQGILMARSGLTADAAFAYLQRLSQTSNRKLRVIAQEVLRAKGPISSAPPAGGVDGASAHGLLASPTDSEI